MGNYLMGIDRGSTNIKVAAYDFAGRETAIAATPLELPRKYHFGWAEQDMDLLWESTARTVRRFFQTSGICPEEIAAVGFSGHGSGLYAIDRCGKPARLAILSMDSRVFYENQEKEKRGEPVIACSKTDTARLLQWVKEHEPEVYGSIDWVMAAKDWLRYRMTGEVAVSRSDFGLSLFMDRDTLEYDYGACDRFGIPEARGMLPPFRRAWDVCGCVTAEAAAQTGLLAGTPCVAGGHDCSLASFGVGGVETGHLTAVFGTFAMNMLVGRQERFPSLPDSAYGMYDMSVLPGRWLYMNSTMSGRGLDWFINTFCESELQEARRAGVSVQSLLEQKAAQADGADVIYHPFILPAWDHPKNARVGLYGANMFTTRGDILRAVFEGIAFAEVQALEALTGITPVNSLTITGGGSYNKLWGQIFADLLGLPVIAPDLKEAACRGAALLAGIGIGVIPDHRAAAAFPLDTRQQYLPGSPDAARSREKYERFLQLIGCVAPFWCGL